MNDIAVASVLTNQLRDWSPTRRMLLTSPRHLFLLGETSKLRLLSPAIYIK